jgi:hypothetical protein
VRDPRVVEVRPVSGDDAELISLGVGENQKTSVFVAVNECAPELDDAINDTGEVV